MVSCSKCGRGLGPNDWFCNHCGKQRPDCPECGTDITIMQYCVSCSAAPQAPCEKCGKQIDASLRECPHCSYDSGEGYEEAAENKSVSTWKFIVGIVAGTIIVGQILSSMIHPLVWIPVIFLGLLLVVVIGPLGYLLNSWAGWRESQSERATAADIEAAETKHMSAEYVEEQRRKKEKKKEQRHRTHVQCPECGWDVEMSVEGQVTDVQADTNSGSLSSVNSALDTLGADTSKDCPHCGVTVHASTELV